NEGVKIYYEIEGEGPPVIMIHGFAASIEANWKATNWVDVLKDDYKLILIDCRGHGKSDKPKDAAQYGEKINDDIVKLLDHLSIEKANFFGYSMGARITTDILLQKQNRFISAIIGGFPLYYPKKRTKFIAKVMMRKWIKGLKKANLDDIKNKAALRFRKVISEYADSHLQDLEALVYVLEGDIQRPDGILPTNPERKEALKRVNVPVMTVFGADDSIVKRGKFTGVQLVPGSCHFQIEGKDHITVVADPKFHMVVKAFLDYINKN
ncbi:MAG: alpha/beta fold hydrolase, partial [Candidatus Heimdallarchaeota archaeon]